MCCVLKIAFILFLLSFPTNAILFKAIPDTLNGYNRTGIHRCEIPCQFSANPENPDAEFFTTMNDGNIRDAIATKPSSPYRLIGSHEPTHYYHLMKPEFLKHHFHGTCFLDRNSDVPWVLMPNMDKMKKVPISKNAKPKASFVARNCHPKNARNDYVKAIGEVVGIVAQSVCFNNADWPKCGTEPCTKVEAISEYKIHLAFENGDSSGFITDKIYHAFQAGVLPVWMGTRDVIEVVPENSYIDVAEFDTPYDVANFLKAVLANETLYNSYFEWKKKPFSPKFARENRVLWSEDFHCRACYYVDALKRGVKWDHLRQRAHSWNTQDELSFNKMMGDLNLVPICSSVSYILYLAVLLNLALICFLIWKKGLKCCSKKF